MSKFWRSLIIGFGGYEVKGSLISLPEDLSLTTMWHQWIFTFFMLIYISILTEWAMKQDLTGWQIEVFYVKFWSTSLRHCQIVHDYLFSTMKQSYGFSQILCQWLTHWLKLSKVQVIKSHKRILWDIYVLRRILEWPCQFWAVMIMSRKKREPLDR